MPLVLAPIFTHYLAPEDYGIVATGTVIMNIFIIFQGLNASGWIARAYFAEDRNYLRDLVSTSTWASFVLTGILILLTISLKNPLSRLTEFPAAWLPCIVILGLFSITQSNYTALLQARKEPFRFVMNQTADNIINASVSVILIVFLHWNWKGRIAGMLVSGSVISLICLRGFFTRLHLLEFKFSWSSLRELVHLGVPLIPHIAGGWVMTMSSRLYLNHMASVADTGLFSLAFSMASPLIIITASFNKTYYPWLFSHLSSENPVNKVRLCHKLMFTVAVLLAAGVLFGFMGGVILPLIVAAKFRPASPYVIWLSMAFALQGVYFVFSNLVIYSKQTHLMSWRANFLGGVVVLISCPVLIKMIGPIGAAVANCLGVFSSVIGCIVASRIAYPMPWKEAFMSLLPHKISRAN